jgi:hypothetical protein
LIFTQQWCIVVLPFPGPSLFCHIIFDPHVPEEHAEWAERGPGRSFRDYSSSPVITRANALLVTVVITAQQVFRDTGLMDHLPARPVAAKMHATTLRTTGLTLKHV